ncbi:MAG: hypothetical protein LBK40_01790, partial [Spirochaetaceae bacterium]|nr:hypothetical protein [Spirochaetaceae bacterium]
MNKAPDIFLKNASYLDIETEELRRGDILIRHGKIIKIAPGLESGQNTLTVNCSGSFVIPSLFDMHVHLNSSEMLDLFIANGVTGVRNMWGYPLHLEWKKQIEAAALTGPYVFSTGPLTDGVM